MEGIRLQDARIQKEIEAASGWYQAEARLWLSCIPEEEQTAFRGNDKWNDMMHVLVYVFRLYGHSQERTVRMAGLLCLLCCSGQLHDQIPDGMAGVDKRVQYRLLVGDQMMARALQLLTEDDAWKLTSYFARIVIRMSEGMTHYLERGTLDEEILLYTHASWYEAAFYSAAYLAGKSEEEQEKAGQLGLALGLLWESIREEVLLDTEKWWKPSEWELLPQGWEKEALLEIVRRAQLSQRNMQAETIDVQGGGM